MRRITIFALCLIFAGSELLASQKLAYETDRSEEYLKMARQMLEDFGTEDFFYLSDLIDKWLCGCIDYQKYEKEVVPYLTDYRLEHKLYLKWYNRNPKHKTRYDFQIVFTYFMELLSASNYGYGLAHGKIIKSHRDSWKKICQETCK